MKGFSKPFRICLWIAAGCSLAVTQGLLKPIALEKDRHGDLCVRCAASHTRLTKALFFFGIRIPLHTSDEIRTTPLTKCWEKYRGGCSHDWVFHYVNAHRRFGTTFGDGFPYFREPTASLAAAEEFAKAIERLESVKIRALALEALGNRRNLLRYVPAHMLYEVPANTNDSRDWWQIHSKYFAIATNESDAIAILNDWELNGDGVLELAIEKCRELIRSDRK